MRRGAAVDRAYLENLERLPFVERAEIVRDRRTGARRDRFDGRIRVTTPKRTVELPFELKRTHLARAIAERLVHDGRDHPGFLVMAPHVGRELADVFIASGVNFVDLAGNCFVRLGDDYVAVIQGQRAERRPAPEKALRAPAYRVLFALLADPALVDGTARALADAAGGVSPQTANDVRKRLLARGVLLETRGGVRWVPGRRREVIDELLLGFPVMIADRVIGRYRAKERDPDALERALATGLDRVGEWRWGGGAAAKRLTGYYRGERTIVYLRDAPRRLDVGQLGLLADREGEVTLVRAPGPLAFRAPMADVVHPVLAYLDLMNEGHDRAREAALELYRTYLEEREQ